MARGTIPLLAFCFMVVLVMVLCLYAILTQRAYEEHLKQKAGKKQKYKGKNIIDSMNHNETIIKLGSLVPGKELENIFNRAKNPWKMTIPTFQFIRYGGLAAGVALGVVSIPLGIWQVSFMLIACGALCWYYPMYFYKATGNEREMEWNKMYEFVWVIKHNIMLYDPAKAYLNVRIYIENHAPHNKEIIQGFTDFYRYWNDEDIDPYIRQFYPFSVPREISQIVFNMSKTGTFPEEELNSLRQFIINTQDLSVEKILSGVSSKATIFSLPFLMITVIISLMVPLVLQIVNML